MNILLDLDGTLTDPKVGILTSLQYALEKLGEDVPPMDELSWCIGPPLKDAFIKMFGEDQTERVAEGVRHFRERFGDVGLFENEVYPDIPELLSRLNEQGHVADAHVDDDLGQPGNLIDVLVLELVAQGLDDAAWERWWRTDKGAGDVTYTQFMGKDNVPFHTLSFPATIMGVQQDWKLVDYIKSFNYLNYDGGQFSTSRGRGVFMDQALEILPSDYWRWWLLSHAPESSDAEFTWENFQTDVNKDLADVLGNFVSRITKFCRSKFSEAVPEGPAYGPAEEALIADLAAKLAEYESHMDAMEVRKSAADLRAIWVLGNEYLQSVAPWTTFKTDPEQAAMQVRMGLNLCRLYGVLSSPFIPDASADILAAMNASDAEWPNGIAAAVSTLQAGHAFQVPEITFRKITDDERTEWAEKFAGTRD